MDKTKETIWFEESNRQLPDGIYPGVMDTKIYNAMQVFADQEKRNEAIAFAEWAAESGWILYPDCDENEEQGWYKPSDDFDIPDERMFGEQLYNLYLQHLQSLTQHT